MDFAASAEGASGLGITDMYNVLEKRRSGEALTTKDKTINARGLVSVLRELHDELNRAVISAYGWEDLADELVGLPGATTPLPNKSESHANVESELLSRLVALNTERSGEEARGIVRWLRPEFQNPEQHVATAQEQMEIEQPGAPISVIAKGKATWPKNMREQVATVRQKLYRASMSAEEIAKQFKRSPIGAVQSVLDALEDLEMVESEAGQYRIQN